MSDSTICTYCKEPLTSDDFKTDSVVCNMHRRCSDKLDVEEESFHENYPDPMKGFTTNLDNFHGDKS